MKILLLTYHDKWKPCKIKYSKPVTTKELPLSATNIFEPSFYCSWFLL